MFKRFPRTEFQAIPLNQSKKILILTTSVDRLILGAMQMALANTHLRWRRLSKRLASVGWRWWWGWRRRCWRRCFWRDRPAPPSPWPTWLRCCWPLRRARSTGKRRPPHPNCCRSLRRRDNQWWCPRRCRPCRCPRCPCRLLQRKHFQHSISQFTGINQKGGRIGKLASRLGKKRGRPNKRINKKLFAVSAGHREELRPPLSLTLFDTARRVGARSRSASFHAWRERTPDFPETPTSPAGREEPRPSR